MKYFEMLVAISVAIIIAVTIWSVSKIDRQPDVQICRTDCVDRQEREVTVCNNKLGDAALGMANGYLLGSMVGYEKVGAAAGGAIGATGDSRCHVEKEDYCRKYDRKCELNPAWEAWSKRQEGK